MAPQTLAPGVRFHPTDVELVKYYLQKKVTGKRIRFDVIAEINVYKFSPSDLPEKSKLKSMDLEWFFFCPRERKHMNGARMNRATEYGHWKTTGRDRIIKYNDKTVGMIKTLIYHEGRAPQGNRTDWVMHEYRLKDDDLAKSGINQDAYVICKIFLKSGPGPRPIQHLFKEDDWSDDDDTSFNACPLTDTSFPTAMNMNNPGSSSVTNLCNPGSISVDTSLEAIPLKAVKVLGKADSDSISPLELPISPKELPSTVTVQNDVSISELPQVSSSHVCGIQTKLTSHLQCQNGMHGDTFLLHEGFPNDDVFSTWGMPGEGNCMLQSRLRGEAVGLLDDIDHHGIVESATLDCLDPYKELDNFYDLGVHAGHDESFIELNDLTSPLENERHWSHLIPSDGLLNEFDQHGFEIPTFLSIDDYGGSTYNDAPAESLLLPGSSLGFISSTETSQKDYADENGNSLFISTENRSMETNG